MASTAPPEPAPPILPFFESAAPTTRGYRLRAVAFAFGVSVSIIEQYVYSDNEKGHQQRPYPRAEFPLNFPISIGDADRAFTHVCDLYDPELRAHVAEMIKALRNWPEAPPEPAPPILNRGSMSN